MWWGISCTLQFLFLTMDGNILHFDLCKLFVFLCFFSQSAEIVMYWFEELMRKCIVLALFRRRISHRTHHQNHGHVENDESWHPVSEIICLWILCYFVGLHCSIFAFALLWFLKLIFFYYFWCSSLRKYIKVWMALQKCYDSLCRFPCLHTPFIL